MPRPNRRRWISALLGGIVLPFDPMLGMVMLLIGLWQPRRKVSASPSDER
ncbi:MAG TPA: hypothetical protein VLS53_05020 [Candidatus Dormibacteraeota bacterium]|nr:hypothetical protein [Candidatus Dormibacteraeota bacterium]